MIGTGPCREDPRARGFLSRRRTHDGTVSMLGSKVWFFGWFVHSLTLFTLSLVPLVIIRTKAIKACFVRSIIKGPIMLYGALILL